MVARVKDQLFTGVTIMQTISSHLPNTNLAPRYRVLWSSAIVDATAIVIDGTLWQSVCAAYTMLLEDS